jgi:hypothetical protein
MKQAVEDVDIVTGNELLDDELSKMYIPDCFAEKFAELIVRECVGQIQPMWNRVQEIGPPPGYDYDTFDLAYNDCMNEIKQHFGVEE